MKTTLLFLLISTVCFGQQADFYHLTDGYFKSYKSRDSDIIKVGDTIHINPIPGEIYTFIMQGTQKAGSILANNDIVINKLKVFGNNRGENLKMYLLFKGYGLFPVYIDYEAAMDVGEIYNPNGFINRNEALNILKEQKELLDLELISQATYDSIKEIYKPLIMGDN